jgi:S1-C subfamily serine protease
MRRFVSYGPAFVVLLTAAAALFAVPTIVQRIGFAETSARIRLAQLQIDDDDILERINLAVRAVAQKVEPSVVHIVASRRGQRSLGRSSGAGWVFDDEGHIVTNAHVVRDSYDIRVQFADGRVLEARLIDQDDYTDIAVLRVGKQRGLFPVERATGEPPMIGDRVFAFGSPFGFKFSMSEGIVSGLGRNPAAAVEISGFANFIQTDAAVNPGNSGGPLVDIKGRLIGMNVAIATGSDNNGASPEEGQSAGISFAIPLATIESVVTQLIEGGEVVRGYLGIQYSSGSTAPVWSGGRARAGVPVSSVVEDGPASAGGLQPYDVILEVNGQRVTTTDVLRSAIAPVRPGEEMQVLIWRAASEEIKDLFKEYVDDPRVRDEIDSEQFVGSERKLAISLGEFPEAQLVQQSLRDYGIDVVDADGRPIVQRLTPGFFFRQSGAYRDGFRDGQVVVSVDGRETGTAGAVFRQMAAGGLLQSEGVRITVLEEGEEKSFSMRLAR